MRFLPRLRTILVLVFLAVMALPLGSIFFLRVYENEIIRQKELALLSQAAYVAAFFRGNLLQELDSRPSLGPTYGHLIGRKWLNPANPNLPYSPVGASLDMLVDVTRDPLPLPGPMTFEADASAKAAGEQLAEHLFRAQTLTQDEVGVVDYSGTLVASTFSAEGRSLAGWEEIQRALQGEHVSLMRQRFRRPQREFAAQLLGFREAANLTVALPVTQGVRVIGAVVLIGRPSNLGDVLYGYRGQLTFAVVLLSLVVLILAIVVSLTVTEPIDAIVRQSRGILRGNLKGVKPVRFLLVKEIRLLHDAIANLSHNLSRRIEYIGGFARSVSHEFKTPLTAIRGSVELLKDHHETMPHADREKFLSHIDSSVYRLQRLVERLLELAEADVSQPSQARADVLACLSEYNSSVPEPRQVAVSCAQAAATVRLSVEVLQVVLQNLIDNAFLHGGQGVKVSVEVSLLSDFVEVGIVDDGVGISPGNRNQIFSPFFTTKREDGGTGLGLNIVRSFVEEAGGSLELADVPNGTKFLLKLPLG